MAQQHHQSDPRVLSRRTLAQDHRTLAALLKPGMRVLDIGCGTGAITAGIAEAVGLSGHVLGLDRDSSLIEIAQKDHAGLANLTFEQGDILSFGLLNQFDIVTAARVLQWISNPQEALTRMKAAVKRDGLIVVLDYNHEENTWDPAPPPAFAHFYNSFLDWRAANQWDNRMADHLPVLFQTIGLSNTGEAQDDTEVSQRGEPGFESATGIWPNVMETIGPTIVSAGFLSETDLLQAQEGYARYQLNVLTTQRLSLKTVIGSRQSL